MPGAPQGAHRGTRAGGVGRGATQLDVTFAFFVYILANRIGGTLYIGVTNDLLRRATEHRDEVVPGFTKRHRVSRLLYYEAFEDISEAIAREKQLKGWNRAWKIRLIERTNPNWDDLFPALRGT